MRKGVFCGKYFAMATLRRYMILHPSTKKTAKPRKRGALVDRMGSAPHGLRPAGSDPVGP